VAVRDAEGGVVKLSLDLQDAADFGTLGPHSPVTVDVGYVRAQSNPYFASPFFGAWPGGGQKTAGLVVTVKIGDVGPAFPEPSATINVGA
jgi:hypothetical protein